VPTRTRGRTRLEPSTPSGSSRSRSSHSVQGRFGPRANGPAYRWLEGGAHPEIHILNAKKIRSAAGWPNLLIPFLPALSRSRLFCEQYICCWCARPGARYTERRMALVVKNGNSSCVQYISTFVRLGIYETTSRISTVRLRGSL
jgi:hypothetical protein